MADSRDWTAQTSSSSAVVENRDWKRRRDTTPRTTDSQAIHRWKLNHWRQNPTQARTTSPRAAIRPSSMSPPRRRRRTPTAYLPLPTLLPSQLRRRVSATTRSTGPGTATSFSSGGTGSGRAGRGQKPAHRWSQHRRQRKGASRRPTRGRWSSSNGGHRQPQRRLLPPSCLLPAGLTQPERGHASPPASRGRLLSTGTSFFLRLPCCFPATPLSNILHLFPPFFEREGE